MFNFLGGRLVITDLSDDEVVLQPLQLLLPAPRSEENQLKDFHEGLQKLNVAIQRVSTTRAQLDEFQKQGSWDSFWGGVSGRNDKDLAKLLIEFGASLEVTQSVVQLVTQVHTVNNNVLRGFNDALVREIERLQADTQTLDGNQNGALVVLYEFKHQIDELLALADGYEYCRIAVSQLAAAQNSHEAELKDLSGVSEVLAHRLQRIDLTMGELLENQQQTQARVEQLEAQLLTKPSWLRQQAVALVAIVISGATLVSIFVS